MYISVHVPKAGGTSLRESFREAFPENCVIFDPPDDDPANPVSKYSIDPEYIYRDRSAIPVNIQLIHGHFHPARYSIYGDCKFITFLREPVENTISLYFFYKLTIDNSNPIRVYFRNNDLSVIDLAKLPVIRHLMSEVYFGNFDMKRFTFVGDISTYESDLKRLSSIMGKNLRMSWHNVNRFNTVTANLNNNYFILVEDKRIRLQLQDILIDDMRFYDKVLSMRENLSTV